MTLLLPLLIAVTVAHAFTVLTLRRSILTEKVSRRGHHLSREYAVDPLEILFVREVMRTNIVALPPDATVDDFPPSLRGETPGRQHLFPVVDGDRRLLGVLPRHGATDLLREAERDLPHRPVGEAMARDPVVAHPDEPLRVVVYRMAETGLTRFPVVTRAASPQLVGMVALTDLLAARVRVLEAERRRERILRVRLALPRRRGGAA